MTNKEYKPNGHVKMFNIEENQTVWNNYLELKLSEGRPQTSINQYKPVLMALEKEFNKSFSDVTVSEIESFLEARQGKNANHLNGFYVTCIGNGWISVENDMILHLLPVEYKQMVSKLFVK